MKPRCQVTRRGDKLLTKPGLGLPHHDDLLEIIANVMDRFQCQFRLSNTPNQSTSINFKMSENAFFSLEKFVILLK